MNKILSLLACAGAALAMAAQTSPWSYGIQAGVTAHTTTASLSDNFKGCVGFTAGVTADYNRLRLKADVTYGQPSFKNQNMYDVTDEKGRNAQINAAANASHLGAWAQVGYTVARMGRVSITPAAGLYYSRYSWRLNDIEWDTDEHGIDYFKVTDTHNTKQQRLSWIASLDVDIRLHDAYTDVLGRQQRLRSSLRVTPWVTRIRHKSTQPSVSGMQVGVNVVYSGLLSNIVD